MWQIHKTSAPPEFIEFCESPDANYDTLSGESKRKLRTRLLEDQGYICCYCGQRLNDDETSIIEHLKPKSKYPEQELDFYNLLVSCDGGQHDRRNREYDHNPHCDSKKSDNELPLSPLDICEDKFKFFYDGSVVGINEAEKTIEILGLNTPFLKSLRKAVIENHKLFPVTDWENEISRLKKRNYEGKFTAFAFVLISYIQNFKA